VNAAAALTGALAVAIALIVAASLVARELRAAREQAARGRALDIAALFAPGIAAVTEHPRALLAWQPLAETARKLHPEAFGELDRAAGGTFPFTRAQLEAAHSQWTADWLAWEHAHDNEFKLKAAAAEADVSASGGSPMARARFDAVEREKLDQYQRRYSEYVRVAKALQALIH